MPVLFLGMAVFMAAPILLWAFTLTSGLPGSVYLYELGKLAALAGFVLLAFQYVLSSRVRWIERGIGLDRLFGIHKKTGFIALVLLLSHPVLFSVSERLQGYQTPLTFLKLLGVGALLLLLVTAGAAILSGVLPLRYEAWERVHTAGYAVFALAFVHSTLIGSDLRRTPMRVVWGILGALFLGLLAHNLWRRSRIRSHPFEVSEVVQETHDTWSMSFDGGHPRYDPGQFMRIQLLRDGAVSEPHPFTISSSPTQKRLSITVKAVGDFTSTIQETRRADRAYIDMPYGRFSFLYADADDLVLIAGGIGISPFMSMLRYIRDQGLKRNVLLLCGNKTEEDIAFRQELDRMESEMPSLKVVHVISRQEAFPGERGIIDAGVLRRYVEDFQAGRFFVCGPPAMMRDVVRALLDLGVPKQRILRERFSLR